MSTTERPDDRPATIEAQRRPPDAVDDAVTASAAAPGASDPAGAGGEDTPPRPRFRRLRRVAVVLAIVIVVVAVGLFAGYRYLLTTDWGVFFTLFDDDHRADNFRSMDTIFPTRTVDAGDDTWAFERDPRPLPDSYTYAGEQRDLDAFLDRTQTTGLVVVHDDTIVEERYALGNDAASRATSWSVAKSFVSALIGIAVDEGHLDSIDDEVVTYLPQLAGSGYDGTTIRDLLTMSSGVEFSEEYADTFADVNMIFIQAMGFDQPMIDYYADLERAREPGTYHDYISSDAGVLAAVLAAATGESVGDYLESRLWQPLGMEADAGWSTDRSDAEIGFCCLNATLRDDARFGRLYLDDGVRDGRRIVPEGWVAASTTAESPRLEPGDNPDSSSTFGYGYQWWIPQDPRPGEFTAIGVWGQYVYVDQTRRIVIARSSIDGAFDDNDHEVIAAFRAIADEVAR